MKTKINFFLTILCLLFAMQAQALVLNIKTDKTNYILGEPVVIYASLQNNSANSVTLPQYLLPNYYEISYEVNGETFKPWMMAESSEPTKLFAANETIREEIKLFFGSKGWTFKTARTYTITAKVLGQASNTLTINVVNPVSLEEQDAAKLVLESGDAGYFLLFEGGGHLTDGIQRLQKIVDNYPNTTLAAYARQALANNLLLEFTDFSTGAYRGIDAAKALTYLEPAKLQVKGFYNTLHTYLSLYVAYNKQNNTTKASATFAELNTILAKNYPNFQVFATQIMSQVTRSQMNGKYTIQVFVRSQTNTNNDCSHKKDKDNHGDKGDKGDKCSNHNDKHDKDNHDTEGLKNAKVVLDSTQTAITNGGGHAKFQSVRAGTHNLAATLAGYTCQVVPVTLNKKPVVSVTIPCSRN